jgi:hypothetical protein
MLRMARSICHVVALTDGAERLGAVALGVGFKMVLPQLEQARPFSLPQDESHQLVHAVHRVLHLAAIPVRQNDQKALMK